MAVKRDDLRNGELLRALVANCFKENTQENVHGVLRCLRDSYVWVPCNPKPDILTNESGKFFPVFSNGDQVPEDYAANFMIMEHHFLEALAMAAEEYVVGIVLDPFTMPFVVEKAIFDFVRDLPTNIDTRDGHL